MNSLELGLLIIDTLISTLTNTEVIYSRQTVLKANEGINLVDLLIVCISLYMQYIVLKTVYLYIS